MWNKGNIELENDSKVVAQHHLLLFVVVLIIFCFLDEFAFVANNLAEEFLIQFILLYHLVVYKDYNSIYTKWYESFL